MLLLFEIGCADRTVSEENVLHSYFFALSFSAKLSKAEYKVAVVALPILVL